MTNMIKSIATLTTIPENSILNMTDLEVDIISHAVYENLIEHRDCTEIDLGFGNLIIKVEEEDIKFRFVPSSRLKNELIKTVSERSSPLVGRAEDMLKLRISAAYKDLFF